MGNSDNWHTPKALKVERAGEPKGTRRGKLRKGERRKGKKARMDEVLAAKKECERYMQYVLDDEKRRVEHPEWYTPVGMGLRRYDPHYRKWLQKAYAKFDALVVRAIEDKVMTVQEVVDLTVSLSMCEGE